MPIRYSDVGYSGPAAYSDLNPRDGGQLLYPMCTVIYLQKSQILEEAILSGHGVYFIVLDLQGTWLRSVQLTCFKNETFLYEV